MEPQHNRDVTPEFSSSSNGENHKSDNSIQPPIYTDFDSPESVRMVGNRYLIDNYVGSDRRGEVYEAIDLQISKATRREQLVSIEILSLSEDQVPVVDRFASQFAKLVNLPHTNIARSIDFGIDDQSVFFTMELLEGTSLRSILNGNSTEAFSENEVMAVIRSTADALTHMHKHGFRHGNLTPDSIFVTQNFDVKIIDFASEVLKQSFDVIGNRQTGSSKSLKPVDDVFGLAAIAYEMLAGEPAYDGLSRTQALRLGGKLRPIGGLSRHRKKALTRALRFDKKPPTVAEFVTEFGVAGDEILRASTPENKSSSIRLIKPLSALLAVAALAAFLQPNFDVIGEKITDWKNVVAAQFSQEPITAEQSDLLSASANETADEAPPEIEAPEAQATLSAQVVQSLESEVAEYMAQDEEPNLTEVDANRTSDTTDELPDNEELQFVATELPIESTPLQVESEFSTASTVVFEAAPEDADIDLLEAVENPIAATKITSDGVVFDKQSLTVTESQRTAAISLLRRGSADKSATIIWWTGENTAQTDVDFAELGVRTEYFNAGQKSMTVYVPIVSDSVSEATESFFVYAQSNLAPKNEINTMEVFVVDDDS